MRRKCNLGFNLYENMNPNKYNTTVKFNQQMDFQKIQIFGERTFEIIQTEAIRKYREFREKNLDICNKKQLDKELYDSIKKLTKYKKCAHIYSYQKTKK